MHAESPSSAALFLFPFVISDSKCCLDQIFQPLSALHGLEGLKGDSQPGDFNHRPSPQVTLVAGMRGTCSLYLNRMPPILPTHEDWGSLVALRKRVLPRLVIPAAFAGWDHLMFNRDEEPAGPNYGNEVRGAKEEIREEASPSWIITNGLRQEQHI